MSRLKAAVLNVTNVTVLIWLDYSCHLRWHITWPCSDIQINTMKMTKAPTAAALWSAPTCPPLKMQFSLIDVTKCLFVGQDVLHTWVMREGRILFWHSGQLCCHSWVWNWSPLWGHLSLRQSVLVNRESWSSLLRYFHLWLDFRLWRASAYKKQNKLGYPHPTRAEPSITSAD